MLLYNLQDGTPLRIAVENNNNDIVQILLLNRADPNISFGYVSIIHYILENVLCYHGNDWILIDSLIHPKSGNFVSINVCFKYICAFL